MSRDKYVYSYTTHDKKYTFNWLWDGQGLDILRYDEEWLHLDYNTPGINAITTLLADAARMSDGIDDLLENMWRY